MDTDLNETQLMLREAARSLLMTRYPAKMALQMANDNIGYPLELWQEISELGWPGLVFPSNYGGEDGSFLDLTVLLEETGRAMLPAPLLSTVVLAGLPILHAGSEKQKNESLPPLCKGKLKATMALTESEIGYSSSAIKMRAKQDGHDFILSGIKMFVPDAHVADIILCVARTSGETDSDRGITVFIVDCKAEGLERRLLKTFDGFKQAEVIFNNVRVPGTSALGKVGQGWKIVRDTVDLAAVAKSAEMLGGAEAILARTIDYAKIRHQFDQPIGAFQAVQHRTADMKVDVDAMRLITYQAAWMLSEGIPCRKEISMAKAWNSDAFKRVAMSGIRTHGGVAFMEDHDVSLHYRRAMTSEFSYGDADFHRILVLQEILDE